MQQEALKITAMLSTAVLIAIILSGPIMIAADKALMRLKDSVETKLEEASKKREDGARLGILYSFGVFLFVMAATINLAILAIIFLVFTQIRRLFI